MRRTILYLFAIALSVRIVLSLVRATHGLTITSPWLEGKDDFDGIYIQQLSQIAEGVIPYKQVAISYPPLFSYALYPFYLLGGANLASIPIVLSDAATAVVVYYGVERTTAPHIATAAGLAYALSPLALYYEGYVWYSSQPMTLFMLLGVCLIMRDKRVEAFAALAVAILFKQEAVFLVPVFVALLVHQERRVMISALGAFWAILLAASLPFLASYRDYLSLLTYGLVFGRWQGEPAPEPVTTSAVCQSLGTDVSGTLMSCTYGSTTYAQLVNNSLPQSTLIADSLVYDLEVLAQFVVVPMFLLLLPMLYSVRKNRAIVPLLCVYSGAGFLILFSTIFHPVYRYYYLPVYALLLVAAVDRGTLAVAIAAPIAAVLTPSGAFQELVPVLALLAAIALMDSGSPKPKGSESVDPRDPNPVAIQ